MCGVIAVAALKHQKLKAGTLNRINLGLARIRHRGPDSQGSWLSDDGRIGSITT